MYVAYLNLQRCYDFNKTYIITKSPGSSPGRGSKLCSTYKQNLNMSLYKTYPNKSYYTFDSNYPWTPSTHSSVELLTKYYNAQRS